MNSPVCLFDSGIGGLTVLKKLINKFPYENYIYFADLARVPFGDKNNEEIKAIARSIIEWLSRFQPKLTIMACNASSSVLFEEITNLRSKSKIPIFGMIESCTKSVAGSGYKKLTIWATNIVIKNHAYKNAIKKINQNINVEEIPCPKLVPMIESLHCTIHDRTVVIQEYLGKTSNDSDALILGCTHFPLIKEDIENLKSIKIIDPADYLIEDLDNYLLNHNSKEGSIQLYATEQLEKLERFAKIYLGKNVSVKGVSLAKSCV